MASDSNELPIYELYIDESSQTKHRYLVLGGIVLPRLHAAGFVDAMVRARLPELPAGELSWSKVSRSKLCAYVRLVDVFFEPPQPLVHFHSLVVDTTKVDHHRFNRGNREVGFNKEVYQLVQKFRRLYWSANFHVYLDHRTTPQPIDELRTIVNFGARKLGDVRDWPFRRMHFRTSHDTPLIQMADILTGALAYRLNGHDRAESASPAKRALCEHVLARAGVTDVLQDTTKAGKFTIWHRRLR